MPGMMDESPTIAEDAYPTLLDVVRARRSVRKFEPGREVPRETLLRIWRRAAGRPAARTPSTGTFICVDDPEVRDRVREVFVRQGARLRADASASPR